MGYRIRGLLLTLLTICCCIPVQGKSLYMVSEEWLQATNADGTGLYWDMMRAVYEPEGYDLKTDVFPYARAVHMVKVEQADFWVGSYMDEHPGVLYPEPEHYFDADTVKAAVRTADSSDFSGQKSLEDRTVGWVRDYAYNKYLDVNVNYVRIPEIESGLHMVSQGHVHAVLDAAVELRHAMEAVELLGDDLTLVHVLDLPLYPAFQNTPRGEELRDIYNQRFPDLVESGRIQALYDQYEDYDRYVPGLHE